ncbi:uncharacterized protein [Palaemon carinicauda]|uniref:uncharacterized protein n=1 Tax=Palaemon carinicauda TaxID=392227 RepID=UPI0035B5AA02
MIAMDRITLVVSTILSTSIICGQDIRVDWNTPILLGPTHPKSAGSPLVSSIIFPDAHIGDPDRHREAPPDSSLLSSEAETLSDGSLELPLDFSEINVRVLNRINTVTNIRDFATLFDLELPKPKASSDIGFNISERIRGTVEEEGETFEMANCQPELVTVPLDLPVEASTMYFPTCVRLEQCGGCCFGPLLTCRPTVTKVIKVKVLKIRTSSNYNNARGGGSGRRHRRQSQQSYYPLEVVRHIACECGCRVREEDCNSDLHVYYEGECSCKCKNKDEQTKCEQQNTTKYWDNHSCNCYCRKTIDCGTGEIFSQTTCSCERLGARHGLIRGEVTGTTRRRQKPIRVPIA